MSPFDMTPTIELYSVVFRDYISFSVSYQKNALGWADASQAFFGHDSDEDLKTSFSMAWLIRVLTLKYVYEL